MRKNILEIINNLLNKSKDGSAQDRPKFFHHKEKLIAFLLIGLVIIFADLFLILKSQLKVLRGISAKRRKLQTELRLYKKDLANLPLWLDEADALQHDISAVKNKVITVADLQVLLDGISNKANSCEVRVVSLAPLWKEMDEKPAAGDISALGGQFYGLPIILELVCSYHPLGEFLSYLESNPFVEVERLDIRAGSKNTTLLQIQLALRAYVQKK